MPTVVVNPSLRSGFLPSLRFGDKFQAKSRWVILPSAFAVHVLPTLNCSRLSKIMPSLDDCQTELFL